MFPFFSKNIVLYRFIAGIYMLNYTQHNKKGTNYKFFGLGLASCQTLLQARSKGLDLPYRHWLTGYLTTVNTLTKVRWISEAQRIVMACWGYWNTTVSSSTAFFQSSRRIPGDWSISKTQDPHAPKARTTTLASMQNVRIASRTAQISLYSTISCKVMCWVVLVTRHVNT